MNVHNLKTTACSEFAKYLEYTELHILISQTTCLALLQFYLPLVGFKMKMKINTTKLLLPGINSSVFYMNAVHFVKKKAFSY